MKKNEVEVEKVRPDMGKVVAAVRIYEGRRAVAVKDGERPVRDGPRAPVDAARRKVVARISRGCCGFHHPHLQMD
jgi:hypothetical protein